MTESIYPRCKTCKWWGDDEESWRVVPGGHGKLCGNTENVARNYKVDDRAATQDEWVFEEDRALSVDGSGYFAALKTGPEFGCIHHEVSDKAKGLGYSDGI